MSDITEVHDLKCNYEALKQQVDAAADDIDNKLSCADGGYISASLDIASSLHTLKFAAVLLEILEGNPDDVVTNLTDALRQQLAEAQTELSNSLAKAARGI